MKTILYDKGPVLSEEEEDRLQQRGEEPPLWYVQIPETAAECAILTYAVKGLFDSNETTLWNDCNTHHIDHSHLKCHAKLQLTHEMGPDDWDSEGRSEVVIKVTHRLSSEHREQIQQQLSAYDRQGLLSRQDNPILMVGTCPMLYAEVFPIRTYPFSENTILPDAIYETHRFYVSIIFPSVEGIVTGWFRVLYCFPNSTMPPIAIMPYKFALDVGVSVPENHFHYHNRHSLQEKPEWEDAEAEDKPLPQSSDYDHRNEDEWGNFDEDDIRNQFPDAATYANWVESSD